MARRNENLWKQRFSQTRSSGHYRRAVPTTHLGRICTRQMRFIEQLPVGAIGEDWINLRGREWVNPQGETKYFNSVQGWRIEAMGAPANAAPEMPPMPPASAFESAPEQDNEVEDDLPF